MCYLVKPKSFADANKFGNFLEKNPSFDLADFTWLPQPKEYEIEPFPLDPDPIVIKMQDGPCGSRKTTGILKRCTSIADLGGYPFLGQQTKILIEETRKTKTLKDWGGKTVDIHGEGAAQRVRRRLEIKDTYEPPAGEFTLTTLATVLCLRAFSGQENVDLFLDEIPSPVVPIPLLLSRNHPLLTDHLMIVDRGKTWSEIECSNYDALHEQRKHRRTDSISKLLTEAACHGLNGDSWRMIVRTKQWDNLLENKGGDEKGQLDLFAVLRPEIFKRWKSTTVAGANFKDSFFYLLGQKMGVNFEDAGFKLHFDSHQNGHRVRIKMFVEGNWSQKRQLKMHKGLTLGQHIVREVETLVGDQDLLYSANDKIQYILKGTKVPSQEWLEIDGGVISALFNKANRR